MFASPWWQLFKPRNWLWAPILLILVIMAHCPRRWQVSAGQRLGTLLQRIDRKGVHTTRVNIRLAFPELDAQQQQAFLQANYQSAGLSLVETAMAWFGPNLDSNLLSFEGEAYWQAALQSGRGILLASAHLGCLEIVGRMFSRLHPLSVMYRPQKLALIDAFAKYYRQRFYKQIIARDDLRGLIRTLKNGGIVWYTPDIDGGLRNSVFVPFFDIQTATLTTTSRLAAKTNAIVLPTFFYRRGENYVMSFKPPLEHFPSGDDTRDAAALNLVIEQAVRQEPTQYLWQYKRFKTRPPGEKRFYR